MNGHNWFRSGLLPVWYQAITRTKSNDIWFTIEPLGVNCSEIWINIKICSFTKIHLKMASITVPERKFVTKIQVRYHDPRWRWQQPVRMFTPRFLLSRILFHVFDAAYMAIVSSCFYVILESVIEFDTTAVNWRTKNTDDLGNSSVRSW